MVHHPCDVFLSQIVKAGSFRKYAADEFMVDLDRTFLVGTACIAVKDVCPAEPIAFDNVFPIFDLLGVGEFASVVGQNDRKQPIEPQSAELLIQAVKDVEDRLLRIGIPKESQHEAGFHKVDCQKTLAADFPNDGIHLDNRGIRVFLHERFELLVRAADPAALVYLEFRFFPSCSESYLTRQVDVPDFEKAIVNVIVDRLLAAHEFILVGHIDLMDGMSLPDQRSNDAIEPGDLFFTGRKAAARFRDDLMRFQMSFLRVVEGFQQGAFVDGRTGIAHIWDMKPYGTDFLDIIRTMLIATTGFAVQADAVLPGAFFSAQRRGFYLAAHPIFAGVE